MNISTDIRPVSYLKSKSADLLKQINDTRRPVIITQNGEPKAVLQDPKSYESMRNAIGMLKLISQGEEDIKKGKTRTQEEVFEKLQTLLKKRKSSPSPSPPAA
jgi:prevent-host-death family protein